MLNLFPIQFLSPLAYLILRLVVGGILVHMGIQTMRKSYSSGIQLTHGEMNLLWCLSVIEIITGVLLVIGLYTQIAALITLGVISAITLLRNTIPSFYFPARSFMFLLGAASCSLFITGAGALAFDLPL